MELRHLRYFVGVAHHLNYSEASRRLLGAYFGLACEIQESGISSIGDLDMAIETGLSMKAPFSLMNSLGAKKVKELVTYAISEPYFELRQQLGLAIG